VTDTPTVELPLPEIMTYDHDFRNGGLPIRMAVFSGLKGAHRDRCLCWRCKKFKPGEDDNCYIADALYGLCVNHEIVTPVAECRADMFEEREDGMVQL
jgi:hypothetical protein